MRFHVYVIDDDPLQCRSVQVQLERIGYQVTCETSAKMAMENLLSPASDAYHVVLLDLSMPEISGLDILRTVCPVRPDLPIVIYTAYGDVDNAVKALKMGAADFVEKKDDAVRLEVVIENATRMARMKKEIDRLERERSATGSFGDIIGESQRINETCSLAKRAADSDIPVLIKGESGVGKEMFARAIHGSSSRKEKPFIAVNCGAIPEALVESILFGHEKGSFTGASERQKGKFREAQGGTLFLDEIGELDLDLQVKLLRALQEKEVEPVGAGLPVKVDVRIISATNVSLEKAVKSGLFREDLYYRLNVFPFTVPPLRERGQDIAILAYYFCMRYADQEGKKITSIAQDVLDAFAKYDWPGNVRQLQNVIFRAIVLCDGDTLTAADFSGLMGGYAAIEGAPGHVAADGDDNNDVAIDLFGKNKRFRTMAEIEAEVVEKALEHSQWRISKTARMLNISRSTLYRKMDEYNISQNENNIENQMISTASGE